MLNRLILDISIPHFRGFESNYHLLRLEVVDFVLIISIQNYVQQFTDIFCCVQTGILAANTTVL